MQGVEGESQDLAQEFREEKIIVSFKSQDFSTPDFQMTRWCWKATFCLRQSAG
jgi:hypothetical protein